MALRMIEKAERKGKLQKDGTIVDATSGNTGPALSFVGAMKGHKVKLLIQPNGRANSTRKTESE